MPPRLKLAFDTFARAFFAEDDKLSLAELLKSFHFYYLSHDGGLIYDYPDRDYEPAFLAPMRAELDRQHIALASGPSLRFVLNWETDANDVDFHIYDGRGGHAYFSNRNLASGGELYADVTTGYGPECFTVPGTAAAFPYTLQGHYYSRGPMGYGMGKLQIVQHDGQGGLKFDDRPFVMMKDRAYVELGKLERPL